MGMADFVVLLLLSSVMSCGGKVKPDTDIWNWFNACFIFSHGVSAQKAFSYVQSRRFCIGINDGFMSQLQDFEMMVKAMQVVPERAEHVGKRTLEDEGDDDDMNGGEMDGNAQKVVRSS